MRPAMPIQTERLELRDLCREDAQAIWLNSDDDDNRRFVPDEVFATLEKAQNTVDWLISSAQGDGGPYLCPVWLKDGGLIGYVQACRIDRGWEVGYHIAKTHTGKGYATEALRAFLPEALRAIGESALYGEVLEENRASQHVLEKCGFELEYRGKGMYQGETRDIRIYVWRGVRATEDDL